MSRWAVVLAGGVGSRFWPLSTPARPKQLLPLATDEAAARRRARAPRAARRAERTLVLTNAALVDADRALLPELPAENIIAEPKPAGTAAALAWAAHEIARRDGADATMICVHADWAIGDDEGFRGDAAEGRRGRARDDSSLVTVGVVPTRPDPGFGYIQPGDRGQRRGASRVERFVEKPDRAQRRGDGAATDISGTRGSSSGASGIFSTRCALTPGSGAGAQDARPDEPRRVLSRRRPPVSVDVGVLERSEPRDGRVPGEFGWDDVGTWAALRRVRPRDDLGNADER